MDFSRAVKPYADASYFADGITISQALQATVLYEASLSLSIYRVGTQKHCECLIGWAPAHRTKLAATAHLPGESQTIGRYAISGEKEHGAKQISQVTDMQAQLSCGFFLNSRAWLELPVGAVGMKRQRLWLRSLEALGSDVVIREV